MSKERLGILTEQGARGAPEIVVEVLSPGSVKLDLGPKRTAYAKAGVVEMWVVHPRERRIDLYRLQDAVESPERSWGEGDALTTEILPGFVLRVDEAFES